MKGFGKKEDIVDFDFQGWPVYKMNIRSILEGLGFECKDGKWIIDDADPTLDIYPRVLEDDGMGYGVNEQCITSFDAFENGGNRYCNVFVSKPIEKIELWVDAKFHYWAFVHQIGENEKVNLTAEDIRKTDDGKYEYLCHWEIGCEEIENDEDGSTQYVVTNDKRWFSEDELDWGWNDDDDTDDLNDEKE